MRRQQKEQERLRQENERRREREEEDALEKVMKTVTDQQAPQGIQQTPRAEEVKASTDTDSSSPSQSSGQDKAAAERERQRLREQERRRREAVSLIIQLNSSSIHEPVHLIIFLLKPENDFFYDSLKSFHFFQKYFFIIFVIPMGSLQHFCRPF